MARVMRYKEHNGASPTKSNPHKGMEAFLLSDRVQDWASDTAKKVAEQAAAFAPHKSGELAGGFQSHPIEPQVYDGNPRRSAEVRNDVRYAAPVEFGSRTNKAQHMLARAGALHGEYHAGRRRLGE